MQLRYMTDFDVLIAFPPSAVLKDPVERRSATIGCLQLLWVEGCNMSLDVAGQMTDVVPGCPHFHAHLALHHELADVKENKGCSSSLVCEAGLARVLRVPLIQMQDDSLMVFASVATTRHITLQWTSWCFTCHSRKLALQFDLFNDLFSRVFLRAHCCFGWVGDEGNFLGFRI